MSEYNYSCQACGREYDFQRDADECCPHVVDLINDLRRENAELRKQLDRYTRIKESGKILDSFGDALDMVEELESLRKQLEQAEARCMKFEEMLFALGAMNSGPCFSCGYNGPGFYNPENHPCAAKHHEILSEERWKVKQITSTVEAGPNIDDPTATTPTTEKPE